MVYNGKPSRGCENCRKLHVKCDEKLPECSRCLKMKKKCSGYQDQSNLIFRDESARTREKARQSSTRSRATSWSLVAEGYNNSPLFHDFGMSLPPSLEDFAICHFYYTTLENLPQEDHARYLHMQLPALYHQSDAESALRLATQAISYASSTKFGRNAAHMSRKRYVQAIRAVETAIRNPVEVKDDRTLYAVLLLCGYETIMCDSKALPAWGTHVDGAAALVRVRGHETLSSPVSRSIFFFVRKNIVLSHMQTSRPIDTIFTERDSTTSLHENVEDQLVSKATGIPELQHQANSLLVHSNCSSGNSSVEKLITAARILDRELSDWASNVPVSWKYSTATNLHPSPHSGFIPRHLHRYVDFYTARVWNLFRVSRLIVQSILLRGVSWLHGSSPAKQKELDIINIESNIRDLVNDICASVSFLLGHDLSKMKHQAANESVNKNARRPLPSSLSKDNAPTASGRFSLIWPLYIASSASSLPDEQRRWMRAQLRLIAEGGESQAQILCGGESQTLSGGIESFQFDCV